MCKSVQHSAPITRHTKSGSIVCIGRFCGSAVHPNTEPRNRTTMHTRVSELVSLDWRDLMQGTCQRRSVLSHDDEDGRREAIIAWRGVRVPDAEVRRLLLERRSSIP